MVEKVFNNRYKLIEKIGSGGMADVYKAEDNVLERTVALKVLHPQFAQDDNFIARFRREAQSAANLNHPNIVNIYDWGKEGDSYFIVMEHLKGKNLKQVITAEGNLPASRAINIASQVCDALNFAHSNDVVHRDIKPHNIIITPEGVVKVTDFGIARAGASTMTQTGTILGTAHYISPEQAQGRSADSRSDIYSLGIVLYEMLSGEAPFNAENPVAIAMKQVHEPLPDLKALNSEVPDSLVKVLNKALAKSPKERYQEATELKRDLSLVSKGIDVSVELPSEDKTVVIPAGKKAPAPSETDVKTKPKKKWPAFTAAFIILALIAGGLIYAYLNRPPTVVVPSVTKMSITKAKEVLQKRKLGLKIVGQKYSNHKKGLIISQDPIAESKAEEGSIVKVIISKGKEKIEVPELYGKSLSQVKSLLSEAGLNLGNASYRESEGAAGIVISQSPEPTELITKGSSVNITLSKAIEKATVPSVIGKTSSQAKSILSKAGFSVSATESYDTDIAKGKVIRQDPTAGSQAKKGSTVTIYVSKGPKEEKVTVPSVVGMQYENAKATLESLGFQVSPQGTGSTVSSQSPEAGQEVEKGSTVTLFLST